MPTTTRKDSPKPATRPSAETLRKSPEANATRSRAAGVVQPSDDEKLRQQTIERAAYSRAEQRGFAPGYEMDDWLAAEKEYEQSRAGKSEKH
jgi:hypothetical protein